MHKAITLTAALEDYLEAIFNLCRFDQAARSRDIAESLNVHKSTVTAALKSLGQMNLINYAPYEAVTLTPEGRKLAADVVKRHAALRDFFVDILKVDVETAEKAACGMEHSVPREIVEKLADFAHSMSGCPRLEQGGETTAGDCVVCTEASPKGAGAVADAVPTTLDAVRPGQTVMVASIKGDYDIKKRLSEMGLTKGVTVTVERVAPLGDPLDIRVRGYRLSLRREEAARVQIIAEKR